MEPGTVRVHRLSAIYRRTGPATSAYRTGELGCGTPGCCMRSTIWLGSPSSASPVGEKWMRSCAIDLLRWHVLGWTIRLQPLGQPWGSLKLQQSCSPSQMHLGDGYGRRFPHFIGTTKIFKLVESGQREVLQEAVSLTPVTRHRALTFLGSGFICPAKGPSGLLKALATTCIRLVDYSHRLR